jgi:hypothetical protein
MTDTETIAIIGGTGHLGAAIARRLAKAVSTSVFSVQILQLVDNAYNRCNCAQATDCVPGIQQFGTRPKSRQAANCALNMSAFSVQKRPLSAIDVQNRGMCSRIRAILHRRFRLKPPSRRHSTVESRQRYPPALVRACASGQKLLKYWTHTSDVDRERRHGRRQEDFGNFCVFNSIGRLGRTGITIRLRNGEAR